MKIGEIVEILIRVKDDYGYSDFRKEAVEEACNLLDKLPAQEEATTYEPFWKASIFRISRCSARVITTQS